MTDPSYHPRDKRRLCAQCRSFKRPVGAPESSRPLSLSWRRIHGPKMVLPQSDPQIRIPSSDRFAHDPVEPFREGSKTHWKFAIGNPGLVEEKMGGILFQGRVDIRARADP